MMKKIKGKIAKKVGSLFSLFYQTSLHIIIVGLCLFAIFLGLFYTNPGAKLSLGLMNVFLKHPIHVEDIEGTLAGPLTLKKVTTNHGTFSFSADSITANWAPDALQYIRKSIHIKQLKADNIKIIYHSDQEEWLTEIPSLEDLGKQLQALLQIQLKIEDFQAHKIAIDFGQEPIHIQSLTFTRGASHQNHLFKTLNVEAEQGTLSFDQSDKHIKLKWDFKVSELNDFFPILRGDIVTTGNLRLHDLNQIDQDTIVQMNVKSKQIVYADHHLQNILCHISGNFEKHQVNLNGKIDDHHIDTTFVGNLDKTRSHWEGDLKKLLIHHKRFGKLPHSTGKLQIHRDTAKNSLDSHITMNVLGNNAMNAHFLIDQDPSQLSGQVQAQLVDLEFLIKFFPQLEDIHGDAHLTLNVKGDLWSPVLWGNIALKDCTIDSSELSNLSTKLHLSVLNLDSTGDGKLNINGKGTLGKGHFTLEGTSDFSQVNPVVDLALKGKNLTLSQTPEYFIVADPNLRLQLKDNHPFLSGTLFIPEADIETQAFGSDMIEPSQDMVIIDSAQSAPKPEPVSNNNPLSNVKYDSLMTNINIELGDKIRYKGFGLESHVAGKLNIFTQNANLHAHGKLTLVNGQYRAHGNVLEIQHGQIAFLGDQITNPTWDIRAAKQIYTPIQNKLFRMPKKQQDTVFFETENNTMMPHKPVLVGVSLKGTVQNPILKMFSVPTLKEADIISYLVLNKPQRDVSEAQSILVLEAANEFINFLGDKRNDVKLDLAKSLKLDKFGLSQVATNTPGQSDLKQTALVIGKQLSKKLYAEYSLRVLDTASTLSLRYLVGKHIVLEGSASKDSASGDILFTFESG